MTIKIVIVGRLQADTNCSHVHPTWSSESDDNNGSFDDRDFCVTARLDDGQVQLPSELSGAVLSPDRAIKLAQLIASAAAEAKDCEAAMSRTTREERESALSPDLGKSWHERYEDATFYRNKNNVI